MKAPSPLLGFNNNVRHKGRMFHIQTEDSGIRHPHIITHLFADGGRILKSTKTSYAEHVGTPSMAETVRELMKEQHKAMFIALRDGQLDYLFDPSASRPASASAPDLPRATAPTIPDGLPPRGSAPTYPEGVLPRVPMPTLPDGTPSRPPAPSTPELTAAPAPPGPPPAEPSPPARPPVEAAPPPVRMNTPALRPQAISPPRPAAASASAGVAAPAGAAAAAPKQAEPMPGSKRTSSRPRLELDPAALHTLGLRSASPPTAAARPPSPLQDAAFTGPSMPAGRGARAAQPPEEHPTIDLDLDALERAASEAQTPFMQQFQDLPPPPASVMGRKTESGAGTYSAVHPAEPAVAPAPPEQLGGSVGRYAPSRPSSIFATTRPAEGASIFGEDLISEKSLDEVILSYLAEDLDGPQEKK